MNKELSRRDFLKIGAKVVGASAIVGIGALNKSAEEVAAATPTAVPDCRTKVKIVSHEKDPFPVVVTDPKGQKVGETIVRNGLGEIDIKTASNDVKDNKPAFRAFIANPHFPTARQELLTTCGYQRTVPFHRKEPTSIAIATPTSTNSPTATKTPESAVVEQNKAKDGLDWPKVLVLAGLPLLAIGGGLAWVIARRNRARSAKQPAAVTEMNPTIADQPANQPQQKQDKPAA